MTINSFERLRSRATAVKFGEGELKIAGLEDIIKSKRAAGRDRNLAVLPIVEKTLREKQTRESKKGPRSRPQKGE